VKQKSYRIIKKYYYYPNI